MRDRSYRILLSISFAFLVFMAAASICVRQSGADAKKGRETQDEKEPQQVQNTSFSWYYEQGKLVAGDIGEANANHADCFVQVDYKISEEDIVAWADIYYNDDYVLPDYDSLSFVKDMAKDFQIYFQTDRAAIFKSDDTTLSDAMEPAIRIECNIPDPEEMERFLEQYLGQIFEKENEEL